MSWDWQWKPYVSVAERKAQAGREMRALQKKGLRVEPIEIVGRKIVTTFWGESWCTHLESFSDFENRLPRGRTYVRNGSVCHLEIANGQVKAIVSGSAIYDVKIDISKLADEKWATLKQQCTGKIGTLLELLQGNLSDSVMAVVTDRKKGLFPLPTEIKMKCSCPDYAAMCKHIAAVLYGVGARLDQKPELLFLLRGVDHEELILADAAAAAIIGDNKSGSSRRRLDENALADVFGIEMIDGETSESHGRKRSLEKKQFGQRRSSATEGSTETTVRTAGRSARTKESAPDEAVTGKSIRDLRARLGMTKTQLAALVGVSATSVSNWEKERGRLSLSPKTKLALSSVMNLTIKQARKRLDES